MKIIHAMTGRPPKAPAAVRQGGSTGCVGEFGYTRAGGREMHKGIDWIAKDWAPVYAAHDGVIRRAGFERDGDGVERNSGYGSRIWLRAGDLVETRYAHLMHQVYKQGMQVEAGTVIGYVGRTGNCGTDICKVPTHLHFEWYERDEESGVWVPVNPEWALHGDPHPRDGVPAAA